MDQGISWLVRDALLAAGYDSVHVADRNLAASDDEDVVACGERERRVVVTLDTDYGTILIASGKPLPSVILFRMRDGRPSTQARVLIANIPDLAQDLLAGAIVVIGDASIRVRRLG